MKRKTRKAITRAALFLAILLPLSAMVYLFFTHGQQDKGLKIYFFKGEKLVAVRRDLLPDKSPLRQALTYLFEGPNREEREAAIITQLPEGITVLGLSVNKGVAIINLSGKINAYGGGAAKVRGLVRQIVYTVTELPEIDKAWIWVEGKKKVVLGGEGLAIDRPMSRENLF